MKNFILTIFTFFFFFFAAFMEEQTFGGIYSASFPDVTLLSILMLENTNFGLQWSEILPSSKNSFVHILINIVGLYYK